MCVCVCVCLYALAWALESSRRSARALTNYNKSKLQWMTGWTRIKAGREPVLALIER